MVRVRIRVRVRVRARANRHHAAMSTVSSSGRPPLAERTQRSGHLVRVRVRTGAMATPNSNPSERAAATSH
eukprot:scaffold3743_cov63-Phaeocystis_antarctica.AAC.1